MPEAVFRRILDVLENDHSFTGETFAPLHHFQEMFADVGEQFLSPALTGPLIGLRRALRALSIYTAYNFFVYPANARDRYCLYPELNVDRGAMGSLEEHQAYEAHAKELGDHIREVRGAYANFRRAIKESLYI